jgi:hypothetical protein
MSEELPDYGCRYEDACTDRSCQNLVSLVQQTIPTDWSAAQLDIRGLLHLHAKFLEDKFQIPDGRFRQKLNFSLAEIELFYRDLYQHRAGRQALQTYAFHVLFWTTGVRPSSIFGRPRKDSHETVLKWQHKRFFHDTGWPSY